VKRVFPLLLLAAAILAPACGGDDGETATRGGTARITVAAASDLRDVLAEIQPAIEQSCGASITFAFGSSGQLKTQVEAGAPFALFLSADRQYPEQLQQAGLLAAEGLAPYAVGRIVLATRQGIQPLASLDGLRSGEVGRIAIGNPDHAPYGRAAKQALESSGLYAAIESKLVLAENIRQATDYVERGDADAAIVSLALVIKGSPVTYTVIDSGLHQPIEQTGAIIRGSGAEDAAHCMLEYLRGPQGQAALAAYGFEEPPR